MGIILPKAPAFYLIDALTRPQCLPSGSNGTAGNASAGLDAAALAALACPTKPKELAGPSECTQAGGVCVLARDGFYTVGCRLLFVMS